jgi:hypothetical protein
MAILVRVENRPSAAKAAQIFGDLNGTAEAVPLQNSALAGFFSNL